MLITRSPAKICTCGSPTERPIDCDSWPFGVPEFAGISSGYAPAAPCRITQRVTASSYLENKRYRTSASPDA